MELDKKLTSIICLCFIVAFLYIYREVNVIKLCSKTEHDKNLKRFKSYDEFQSNFDNTLDNKLKSIIRSDKSDE